MLEVGKAYPKPEMSLIFGTRAKQGLDRKLERYGITFSVTGRGEQAVYEIHSICDPFKVFAITELGFDANTDFRKLRNFYYYFFNDEEFMAMPDEVKEARMRKEGKDISRQTIAGYTQKLIARDLVDRSSHSSFIYYFAYKGEQRIVERAEYSKAWREYWQNKDNGMDYYEAILDMIVTYGGVARKQPIPELNGIYNETIEYLRSLIQQSIENEIGG